MCVEHAFGMLKKRFPILALPMQSLLQTRADTVWCCLLLHNFFIDCGESNTEFFCSQVSVGTRAAASIIDEWIGLAADATEALDDMIFESRGRPSAHERAVYTAAAEIRDMWYSQLLQLHESVIE